MPKKISSTAELPSPELIDIGTIARSFADGSIDLLTVLGPTASGKTRYAVSLASTLISEYSCKAEIISADSRQVYRRMDIGTGKDLNEYGDIPFHLIDIAEPGTQYNVYEFKNDFKRVYADIRKRSSIPILCGGTGMYINAVTNGYDFASKTPLSTPRAASTEDGLPARTFFIGTLVDRETRNAKIDARLDARLEEGMIDEIRQLLESGIAPETLLSYGLEYKFVTLYLLGDLSFEQMRENLSTAIHQFAKRQMTWFRGMERSGVTIHWTKVGTE